MSSTVIPPPKAAAFTLREAMVGDADLVHALTQAAYDEYRTTDAPSSVAQEKADDLRAALKAGNVFALVAETGDAERRRTVGSVRYRWEDEGETLYFFRLGVLPEVRGLGIARQLVNGLEATARKNGARRLRCCVRLHVARNVDLYEKAGFTLFGEPWTVRRGSADVVTGTMEKELRGL